MEHDITKMLRDAIARKQASKTQSDVRDFAKEFSKELAGAISPDDISKSVENKIVNSLAPTIQKLIERDNLSAETIQNAISQIKIPDVYIDTQDINNAIREAFSSVSIPQPKVHVTIPPINIPEVKMPDEMNVKGWVSLMGVSLDHPLPVQLRDARGNPINLFENLTTLVSGGSGGGKHDHFTIKGFGQSAYADYLNPDNRLRVSVETGGSGLTDAELRATAVPVSQVSGSIWSTAVIDIFGSTAASGVFNADNRIKVSVETGGSGLTDSELRASAVPVSQVSGASWSTEATQSGTWNIGTVTTVTGITNSVAASIVDSSGVQYSGSNPFIVSVSGNVTSTGAYLLNADGTYRDTVPISGSVSVSGSITSTVVTGPTVADVADDGSAPVQVGGVARTANPTAVANGDVVKSTHDDLGRQVTRPVQVRDLVQTAYVSLTTGTETTLLAGASGVFHDLIHAIGTNNSDAAVTVDIRSATGGGIVTSIRIPANGTAGASLTVPIPQDVSADTWTADLPDITGTTVTLSGLFSKEV